MKAILEIPAASRPNVIDRLGAMTKGTAFVEVFKMSENQFVLPGDVIVTGDYRPEQNVILEGNRLMSTAIGFSEIKGRLGYCNFFDWIIHSKN